MATPDLLSFDHRQALETGSAIASAVIAARGYRTVTVRADLHRLGFSHRQARVPALLIPVWRANGQLGLYQARPDDPRIEDGKPIKYETPYGARMALDVSPPVRSFISDPARPLFVTEGMKKADSLASRGCCPIALLGVWNWRGINEAGGKTALADWEVIALDGRLVYIVFDSDLMTKPPVHQALARLKGFLESRGAAVDLIHLPSGPGGAKVGVDDYFAQGRTLDDLLALSSSELRVPQPPDRPVERQHPYEALGSGLVWLKKKKDDIEEVPLTNFTATIIADVVEDDGAEARRSFEVKAWLRGRSFTFTIPAGVFALMNWPTEHMGAGAVMYPGFAIKDHARAAIQFLSGQVPEGRIYTHTGWRKTGAGLVYLHAAGAIGVILRGRGKCFTNDREFDLSPGMGWRIPVNTVHHFETTTHDLDVVAWHPDSDFGPTDEDHPMKNRTLVGGVSRKGT